MSDIRQFKLTSGDEIVCQVVAWPESEDDPSIVIRSAYQVVTHITEDGEYRQFRPWMVLQNGRNLFQSINADHILADANPSKQLLEYYARVVIEESEEEKNDMEDLTSFDDSDTGNLVRFPGKHTVH